MFKVEQKQQELANKARFSRSKSFILRNFGVAGLDPSSDEHSDHRDQKGYLHQSLAIETNFGHTFLFIPVFLILGAYFNFSRKLDIDDAFLMIPIIVLSAIAALQKRINIGSKFVLLLLSAFFIGAFAANIEMKKPTILIDSDVTTNLKGIVLSKNIGTNGSLRYKILINSTSQPTIKRPPHKVQLLSRSGDGQLKVGHIIETRARLTRPSGPVYPKGYDFAFGAYINDIGAYGFILGAPKVLGSIRYQELPIKSRFELFVGAIQSKISNRINDHLSGDAAAISSALIIADKKAISEETVTALRNAGLAHILAISGLHMVLASGTLFLTLRALLSLFPSLVQAIPVKKVAAVAALLAATSYLVISGAPISAQRAWLMLVIMLGATILDKPAITLRNVAIAAIIIVLISPSSVTTPGFQMSFAAATALVSVYGAWARIKLANYEHSTTYFKETYLYRSVQFVVGLGLTALIAGLATGIFSSLHFHQLAGYGVLGNVLAMPVVTFFVMPLALLSMLLMPYGLEWLPLSGLGQSIEIVIYLANWVAGLGGEFKTGRPTSIVTGFLIAGFIIFVLFRSSIRLFGLLAIITGLVLSVMIPIKIPDVFISEDGKLVGIRYDQQLFVNRTRPSSFISDQWLNAYLLNLQKPEKLNKTVVSFDIQEINRFNLLMILDQGRGFICLNTHFCMNAYQDKIVTTLGKTEHLELACKFSDIIVATFGVNRDLREGCASKTIISRYDLKQSGSMAFYSDDTSPNGYRVETAISEAIRPWTIQRYFNWRANEFWLPNGQTLKRIAN
ncbi:MAG: ComEC/Rec2 family competence protein [Lentilitoribacter sp.]